MADSRALDHPPLVPFFPLLMKDLAFMHEGNDTIIDGLVNFDKLRLLSRELRLVSRALQRHQRFPLLPLLIPFRRLLCPSCARWSVCASSRMTAARGRSG